MRALLILFILSCLIPQQGCSQTQKLTPESIADDQYGQRDPKKQRELALQIKQRYDVNLIELHDYDVQNSEIAAKPYKGKMDVGTRVLKALSVYPADFIKKSDLRQIVVCEDLKYKNKRVGGLTSPTRRTIFLSCESLERSYTCLLYTSPSPRD